MKLIETDPRENVRLYAGILVLILLSYYAFGFRPANDQLTASRTEYLGLRKEIITGRQKSRELLGYAGRVRDLKGQVLILEERLRSGNQVLLFFQDAELAAARSGVRLADLSPSEPTVEKDVVKQEVQVQVDGGLAQMLQFVRRLEGLVYPVRVTKVDLNSRAASVDQAGTGAPAPAAGTLEGRLTVELYSLSNTPSAMAVASAPAAGAATPRKAGENK